ncbi:MAG: hypothetical protein ABJX32_18520 [Tateyamaria sp.]|uniref:bestrophin-like domain n=1 Tax=Tateyamaria sp. TaxID=1929288 RepID=UPI00329CBB89
MSVNPLEFLPLWAYFSITVAFIGIAVYAGWTVGARSFERSREVEGPSIGITVGALLSLTGFLLAFTFSMVNARFEDRRQTVLIEANAIGTAYLRTDLLPEPKGAEARELLRQYIELRIVTHAFSSTDPEVDQVISESEDLQAALWAVATEVAQSAPTPISGYFVQSINEVIDVHSVRVIFGTRSTIPTEIWVCLYVLAAVGMAASGFLAANSGGRNIYPTFALVLTFSAILTIITDLDNPGQGAMRTDQAALIDQAALMPPGT